MALRLTVLMTCLVVALTAHAPSTPVAQDIVAGGKEERPLTKETEPVPAKSRLTQEGRVPRSEAKHNHTLLVEPNKPLNSTSEECDLTILQQMQRVITEQQHVISQQQHIITRQQEVINEQQRMASDQASTIISLQNSVTQQTGAVAERDHQIHNLRYFIQQQQGQNEVYRPPSLPRRSSYPDAYSQRQQDEQPSSHQRRP